MLFQGAVQPSDIPAIDMHYRVGGVGYFLPLPDALVESLLVSLLVATPTEDPSKTRALGVATDPPAISLPLEF